MEGRGARARKSGKRESGWSIGYMPEFYPN